MNAATPAAAPAPSAHKWRRRALWIIGLLGLAWFGPAIIANSPWRDYAINLALGKVNGRVSTQSASLWWFSPVEISGLRIDDVEGKPMLDVAEIHTSQTLFGFLTDRSRLGAIRVVKPSVHLILSDQSSNLEDALQPLLNSSNDASGSPSLSIVIDAGSVTMDDATTGKSWELRDLAADFASTGAAETQFQFKSKGSLSAPGGIPSKFESEGKVEQSAEKKLSGEVRLLAEKLPLDALTPWLRRTPDPIRVDGALTGEATYRWTVENQHALSLNNVAAETISIAAPKQLGKSQIQLSKLAAQGKVAFDAERIVFEKFALDSSAAKVEATGGADFRLLSQAGDLSQVGTLLRDENLDFKAEIDAAEAAKAFPDLLHIRQGTEITSGKLLVHLTSSGEGEKRLWNGGVKTDALAATHEGKSIVWNKPVDLTLKAHKSKDGIVLDELRCTSSFMTASGSATALEGRLQADADLSALHAELSRFADLGQLQLRGKLQARVDWRQSQQDLIQVMTDARIETFEFQLPGQKPWEERELVIQSTVDLKLGDHEIEQAVAGDVALVSGGDRLTVVLLSPVKAPFAQANWPLQVESSGKLETWKTRLQNFLPLAEWELAGQFKVRGEGKFSSQEISWRTARGDAQQLKAFGASLYIQEPVFELIDSAGRVNLQTGEIELDQLTAKGSRSLSVLAEKLVIRPTEGNLVLKGRIDFEAFLETMQAWTHHPKIPPEIIVQGKAKGILVAETNSKSANVDYSVEITPLTFAKANETKSPRADVAAARATTRNLNVLWKEPKIESSGHLEYELAGGATRLEDVQFTGESVAATLSGTMRDLEGRCTADLTGEIEYDADKLSPLLAASTGLDVQISGKKREPFALRGPIIPALSSLSADFAIPPVMRPVSGAAPRGSAVTASTWPRDLQLDAGVGWTKANLAGFSTGPVEIDSKLREGLLKIAPLDVELAAGKLRLNPLLDLSTRPYLLRFPSGPIVENAAITPQLCRSWLKYVNPLMADVTEAEGSFSLELSESAFPLAQPMLGEASGKLILHQAQVGPGPLSRELIEIGKQVEAIIKSRPAGNVRSWLVMPPQEARFAVQGGRVFHEQITFQARDVTITTRGSVGLDQTIQLLAEVPIKDEWIAKERLLAGLKGQSLQIPIAGTLTDPKVDPRAITEIGAKMVGGAIRNKLDEELEKGLQKGLDKLLRPKK